MRRPRQPLPPIPVRTIALALIIAVVAGLADWVLVVPDEPFDALMATVISGGTATAFVLPMLIP